RHRLPHVHLRPEPIDVGNAAGSWAFPRSQPSALAADSWDDSRNVLDSTALLRAPRTAPRLSLVSGADGVHDRDFQASGKSGGGNASTNIVDPAVRAAAIPDNGK